MAIHEESSYGRGVPMVAYAYERIVAGSATATGDAHVFTTGTYDVTGGYPARAIVEVSAASVRYLVEGTVPTTAVGFTADNNTVFTVEGLNNIRNFKAIRESASAGATDAVLIVVYERFETR
jgi:hypothetical protein